MAASFGFGGNPSSPTSAAPTDASTPWMAASDGNLELLKSSLQVLNLPLSAADENGYTLLQAAASYNQMAIVQWLVQGNPGQVEINATDSEGDTALHYASTGQVAHYLVECGIDRSRRNLAGKTALESKQEELQELMEDEDFDENDADAVNLRSVIDYLSKMENPSQ